jgi:hypothetical protein
MFLSTQVFFLKHGFTEPGNFVNGVLTINFKPEGIFKNK